MEIFEICAVDPGLLVQERYRMLALVRDAVPLACVMEVGSTAVPGVIGKQDIDIMVRVPGDAFGDTRAALDGRFRRKAGQISNAEYQGYVVESALDVAIQLIVAGSQYDRFEAFLARLREEGALREAYNDLKRAWHRRAMDDYRVAKRDFIAAALGGTPPTA